MKLHTSKLHPDDVKVIESLARRLQTTTPRFVSHCVVEYSKVVLEQLKKADQPPEALAAPVPETESAVRE